MKITLKELRSVITEKLSQSDPDVNLWSNEFHYDPGVHTVDELTKAALRYFHQEKNFLGVKSPTDKKFTSKLITRLEFHQIPDDVIDDVIFKLRLASTRGKV